MKGSKSKTKRMIDVSIDESFYFCRDLKIPTLIKEYSNLEKILIESNHLGCITVQIDHLRKIEYAYGSNTYNELFAELTRILKGLKDKKFRKEDIFVLDVFEGEAFIIFLSAPRHDTTQLLDHLESISERVWSDIRIEIFKIFYPLLKENVQPKIGHALVVRNPMIQNLRLITRLIKDSLNMGNFMCLKKEYSSKYMLQKLIIDKDIRTVFQPIVELNTLDIIGYEALARGPEKSEYASPDLLFSLAAESGLSFELDRLCRKKAFESVHKMKIDAKIFVNTLSTSIYDPEFRGIYLKELLEDLKIKPENVVFEISERLAIENYDIFRTALKDYTDVGIVHASDDVGKGYSDLERIMELHPGFLKVDISLVHEIDKSYVKQEIMKAISRLAKGINSEIVAEGIETEAEYNTLKELNIRYGQGYLFAKPSDKLCTIRKKF